MAERDVDFVIAGAGPVGAACALFLREQGIAAARDRARRRALERSRRRRTTG